MTVDAWITLGTVLLLVVLLVREAAAPALVVFGADVLLLVTGVIDTDQALAGFANPAPWTVGALYIVARSVEKTGALQPLLGTAMGGRRSARRALGRLLGPVAAASAFVNNTPIVAMAAPQVASWARRRGWSPSSFLMPLSFAAILGGVVTVIGTSTNLLVSGLMEDHGYAPLGMFEIAPVGLPVAVVGVLYLIVASPRLLPRRLVAFEELERRSRDFIVHMQVIAGGALDGATVEEGGLRHLESVFLTEVQHRGTGEIVAPARPETRLAGGDVLVFAGRADRVLDLQGHPGLRSTEQEHADVFAAAGHTYFEVVLGTASPLVGRTLKEADFRRTYEAAVLGMHRAGEPIRSKLGTVELRAGDTLLLLSNEDFHERWRDRHDFLLISRRGGLPPATKREGWIVAAVLAGVVTLGAIGIVPILHASLLAALLLVGARILTVGEARHAVDLDVVLLIGASFGVAAAVEASGLAGLAASGVGVLTATWGARGALLGVVALTLLLTEMITNNAAAVLVFPVALATAASTGLDPRMTAIAVAVTASSSFLTPIGYQTNTMVYGPGGYRFTDYLRLGTPLTALVVAVILFTVPLLAP
jgi:di/tricarboxylate transporter